MKLKTTYHINQLYLLTLFIIFYVIIDLQVLKQLAIDILSGLAERKELELKIKVNEVITDLSFKFQKASIPRPTELTTGHNGMF